MNNERGISLEIDFDPFRFRYASGVFGPDLEIRRLDAVRSSLLDPNCTGPDALYAIAMDVGLEKDREALRACDLLFGVVAYAPGTLGQEPVRSQGHVHRISERSGWAPPEVFEIWSGRAIIYLQQVDDEDPGRCIAVEARPGEHVVVPPGWAHAAISAEATDPLVFGAWCCRDYGFVYDGMRKRNGLAWFPVLTKDGTITWIRNRRYMERPLELRCARAYPELSLDTSLPLYRHFGRNPQTLAWVANPGQLEDLWPQFEP
jgi:glucose-6-phosphate isomerase, archaeal